MFATQKEIASEDNSASISNGRFWLNSANHRQYPFNEKSQQRPLAVTIQNQKRNLKADQLMDDKVVLL